MLDAWTWLALVVPEIPMMLSLLGARFSPSVPMFRSRCPECRRSADCNVRTGFFLVVDGAFDYGYGVFKIAQLSCQVVNIVVFLFRT